jgi:hypothetical protein
MIETHLRNKDNTSHTMMLSYLTHTQFAIPLQVNNVVEMNSPALFLLLTLSSHPVSEDTVGRYTRTALGTRTSDNVIDNKGGVVPRR